MRVAFVSANREKLPDPVIPLGLLYVEAATDPRHERTLVDLCFEEAPEDALAAALEAFAPDVVAVGIRNLQNADYSGSARNLDYYAALGAAVRRSAPGARVVLGGAGFSVVPDLMMARLGADYGIVGEGEATFNALLDALEAGMDGSDVPGVIFRKQGLVRRTAPPVGYLDLDAVPEPRRELLPARYRETIGIESVQTKRGCPLNCTYCTYPMIEGKQKRLRSPEAVAREFLALQEARTPARHVFVVDAVFNHPPRHAKEVCEALLAAGVSLPWTAYINPLAFDDEVAALMAKAGCRGVEVGSDSGHDRVLGELRKGFTTADIRRMKDICARHGIRDAHTFILGTATESLEDVAASLDFIEDLDPWAAIIMPWTDDEDSARPAPEVADRSRFRDQVLDAIMARAKGHRHWVVPGTGRLFDERFFAILRRQGWHGPLWHYIRESLI